ncbi:MAG TPA: hypothetical protein VKB41_17755 [Steroidobacteraceae bacterium]|nr:hypothetical protein [Steroidobacteraceae bacterium]
MYTPDFVPLPSPHEDVLFRHLVTDQYICAQYIGTPPALVDAGAIDRGMIGDGPAGVSGRDLNGERFRRSSFGNGTLRVDRFARNRRHARMLPGVPISCATDLIAWLRAHPDQLHFETDDSFECVSGTRELLVAHRYARAETFEGQFSFWGTCDDHADTGPERWRCHVDQLFDGFYRVRRNRSREMERVNFSREDLAQTLRAYARHELKKVLAMARGDSHHGLFQVPEPCVRLLEQYMSSIDQAFQQAVTTLAVRPKVVALKPAAPNDRDPSPVT